NSREYYGEQKRIIDAGLARGDAAGVKDAWNALTVMLDLIMSPELIKALDLNHKRVERDPEPEEDEDLGAEITTLEPYTEDEDRVVTTKQDVDWREIALFTQSTS